jgi:hypothetical protein
MRAVFKGSGFAAYLAGVNPNRLSDAELQVTMADQGAVCIRTNVDFLGIIFIDENS